VTLADFIGALDKAGLEIEAEDLLDMFWLASMGKDLAIRRPAGRAVKPPSRMAPDPPTDAEKPPLPVPDPAQELSHGIGRRKIFTPERGVSDADHTVHATPVSVPAGRALGGSLRFMRAVRPLRQGGRPLSTGEMDEERTAELTAEMGLGRSRAPQPVFRAAKERWLSVDIVHEDDTAIELWNDQLRDFAKLLRDAGVFRRVRVWRLRLPATLPDQTDCQAWDQGMAGAILEAPTGSRRPVAGFGAGSPNLVIFAQHGCSPHWTDGVYARLLKALSLRNAVLLLGLMPRSSWRRTQIGEPHGLCHADRPGPLAATLRVIPFWWRMSADRRGSTRLLPVPAVALDAVEIADWSRMFMAMGRTCSVYLLNPVLRRGTRAPVLDLMT
jgi:hypothetical protein